MRQCAGSILCDRSCSKAVLTSAIVWKRRDGCLARHCLTSSAAGDSSAGGSSRTTAFSVSSNESRSKMRRPDSSSYSTTPRLNTSDRTSACCPCACSGDM